MVSFFSSLKLKSFCVKNELICVVSPMVINTSFKQSQAGFYYFMVPDSVTVNEGMHFLSFFFYFFLSKLQVLFLTNFYLPFSTKCRQHHSGEDFQIPRQREVHLCLLSSALSSWP